MTFRERQPMARSVRPRNHRLDTRSARHKLAARPDPYYAALQRGLSIGYYRPASGADGTWWGRARANGRYVVAALATADDHVDADGDTILDWSQAQDRVREWAKRQTGTGPLTVEAACRAYIDDLLARKGARAAKETEGRLSMHLFPVLGQRRLAELTADQLSDWRNRMVDVEGDDEDIRRSRDSANRVLNMARAAFNMAFFSGRVTDDRAWRLVRPFRDVGAARKVLLGETALQLLVDACGPGLRELVLVGAWTGARLGELTSRRVRDFDAAAATLAVRGKTGGRELSLPPQAVALLRQLASGKRPDDHLFTTATGGRWTENLHRRPFKAAVARAGIDPDTVFYSLRHTWISRALIAGAPTRLVAELAGTSVTMIERNYAKFVPSDRQRYATLAAPELRVDDSPKVVSLRR
jgi:integrase